MTLHGSLNRIVVAGTSLAGVSAARTLREEGFDGTITLVGAEHERPYDKPPLSKQFLAGTLDVEQVFLEVPDEVTLRQGTPITGLDPNKHLLRLGDGDEEPYDGLVIATGARPRTLPGFALPGIRTLRTLDDARTLRTLLETGQPQVVIVGSGFIGAEIASACRDRGLDVTVLEADPVPFGHAFGDVAAAQLAALHAEHGVRLLAGAQVVRAVGTERVEGVELADGRVVGADVVVVAIGVRPNTEWLGGSGLPIGDGVRADDSLWVAPGIVAAGDVARWTNPRLGREARIEHWDNAITQGEHAARRLLGITTEPYALVPWVWSDQLGQKIQAVGTTTGHDEARVIGDLAGNPKRPRVLVLYREGERLAGAMGVRQAKQMLHLRELVGRPGSWGQALEQFAQGV